jgi:hypothetical protein
MQLSAEDAHRYRTLWKQVSAGVEPWMLVSGGDGQFGSLARSSQSAGTSTVVALRWRIEDETQQKVYEGTLLLPEGRRVSVDVAAEENPFNRPLILLGNTGQPHVAGFWLKLEEQTRVGVAGRIPSGNQNAQLGTFHHNGKQYHVYAQRQRLNHSAPAI